MLEFKWSQRIYPSDHLAGQLLGHTNIDQQGIEGLNMNIINCYLVRKETINIYKDGNEESFILRNSINNSSNNSGSI